MIKKLTAIFLCCLLVLVFAVDQVQADLVTPESADATSSFGFNPPSLLIDGSGLDGIGDVRDQLHDNVEANNWISDVLAVPPPTADEIDLEFTLDANYNLSAAYIWNLNDIAGNPPTVNTNFRGIKEFDLFVSSSLVDPYTLVGSFTLDQANVTGPSTSDPEPAQTKDFVANNVKRVKFEIVSNFSADVPVDDTGTGLSEVRFEGVVVPEPAAFMIVAVSGLALIGLRRRRGKK